MPSETQYEEKLDELIKRFKGMEKAFFILVKNLAEFEKKLDHVLVELSDAIITISTFMEMMGQRTEDASDTTKLTYG